MKKLPTWMTTVTPLSKILAAVIFITLPFVGLYIGTYLGIIAGQNSVQPIIYINNGPVVTPTPITTTVMPTSAITIKLSQATNSSKYLYNETPLTIKATDKITMDTQEYFIYLDSNKTPVYSPKATSEMSTIDISDLSVGTHTIKTYNCLNTQCLSAYTDNGAFQTITVKVK